MGFKGGVQDNYIANVWVRTLRLRFSGKKLTTNDVTQWIERTVLVEYLPRVMLNVEVCCNKVVIIGRWTN